MEESAMNIQWYPGHMTKTRRMIAEQLKHMDAVCEILDARAPLSSRNPDVEELTGGRPRLIVLNRVDLADPAATKAWGAYFRGKGFAVLEANAKQGQGVGRFPAAVRSLLADKLAAYAEKGQAGRMLRVMILGIPNVGKSTFINQVAKRKTARAEDRPGVTRAKQWVPVDQSLEVLDTPGMLWPKFEDPEVGFRLACTGAVRDEVVDQEELADGLPGAALPPGAAGAVQGGGLGGGFRVRPAGEGGAEAGVRPPGRGDRHGADGPYPSRRVPGREAGEVYPGAAA